jgi:DnaK suppressor protein
MTTTTDGLDDAQRETLKNKLLSVRAELMTKRSGQLRDRVGLASDVEDEGDASVRANAEDEIVNLVESERTRLTEIDHALDKFDSGEYGLDEETGEPIEFDRLMVLPWARFGVATQEERERR